MKIIATIGNWTLIESKDNFIFYDYVNRSKVKRPKKENPMLARSSIAKYGYLELKDYKEIKSLKEIDESLMNEINKITIGKPHF